MVSSPSQQPASNSGVSFDDISKMSYESKQPQIFEILLQKPRHRRMRQELANGERMTDHHVTLDFLRKVWEHALLSAHDANKGAEQGREKEYYLHRADLMLWTSYFGPEKDGLEFPWEYHDPRDSPRLPPETQEEMINRAREESLKQQEQEESEGKNSKEEARLRQQREARERLAREKEEANKLKLEMDHPTRKHSDNQKTVIRKDPQRPPYRAQPDIGVLVGAGAELPDARVFNAFEYVSVRSKYAYPHRWTATTTVEFGLIYLPENWVFIYDHPRPWAAFIGPNGHYASQLNQNFCDVVQICGQQLDEESRLPIPKGDRCAIHGLWVQPVRKQDMDDPQIKAACKELAEKFIRSWVTYKDAASRNESIIHYWGTWVRGLGRKPLIVQLLEDRENNDRLSNPPHGRRRVSVKSEDRSSAFKRERDFNNSRERSPPYKRR